MTGLNENSNVFYLVDFGLAKLFRSRRTRAHIPIKNGKKLTGTARFASLYTHLGIENSRRDDMISLMYVLAFILTGRLPWQGAYGSTKS